jgi:ribonuclease HII
VAAAVAFPCEWLQSGLPWKLRGLNDSKQLTEEEREKYFERICGMPGVRYGIATVEVDLIDQLNILRASHRAMHQALEQLDPPAQHVLVDGRPVKSLRCPHTPLVKGDCRCYSIAAASILAKVTRDRLMVRLAAQYPGYGFAEHKGYATPEHQAAIAALGPCAIHRRSFAPFRPVEQDLFDQPPRTDSTLSVPELPVVIPPAVIPEAGARDQV